MIVIYTPKVTNRIKYTFDFIFSRYFGVLYEITENPAISVVPGNLYVCYDKQRREGFYSVFQDELLLNAVITRQRIFVSRESNLPVFFQTTEHFDLRFDIFSCIFYLLSRYEEYLPHDKDVHGRYISGNSILANKEFNFSPIIEVWLSQFKTELLKLDPALSFINYRFEYLPTFDIDNAYKYLGRNWVKRPPNIFKTECIRTLAGKQSDPYDSYNFIFEELDKNKQEAVFFFLMSDESDSDSCVSPDSNRLRSLIRRYAQRPGQIGMHPSYFAHEKNTVQPEKAKLEQVTNTTINISRQHFLKIKFPAYYKALSQTGIQIDFSLSYPDRIGFRAGYSREFLFYDLEQDEPTSLTLQPSCWMDATYEYYLTKNFNEITQDFLHLITQLKEINGKLVTIFHNDLLSLGFYGDIFIFINQHTKC